MSGWTVQQQRIVALVPKFSASLSLIGSSCIIAECLFVDRRKLSRVYHRLLLSMSLVDVLQSTFNFASTWPIPRGSPNVAFAVGNQASCTTQGFILQCGLSLPILNMCLSIYYLLVIKYSWSERRIRTRAEPWFHSISLLIPFSFAVAGVPMKLYNNADLWCWFSPLPLDCQDSFTYGETTCVRGDNAWIYRWAFWYGELWFCILFVMFSMLCLYREVKRLETASARFDFMSRSGHVQALQSSGGGVRASLERLFMRTSSTMEQPGGSSNNNNTARPSKSRQVASQALCYVGAFYLAFTFATINRFIQLVAGKTFFSTTVLQATFEPAQGFYNYLVYIRPRYIKYKEKNPNAVWYKAFWRVVFPDEQTFQKQKSSQYVDDSHEDEELARTELKGYRDNIAALNSTGGSNQDILCFVENDSGGAIDTSQKTRTTEPTVRSEHANSENVSSEEMDEEKQEE